MYSKTGEIRRDESCLDYAGEHVILYPCHGSKGNQVSSNILMATNNVTLQIDFLSYGNMMM